jgi:hypothetical protein
MEFRSEPVWLDARNAVIDLVGMTLLVPTPLTLAWWFSVVAYEARMAVTLAYSLLGLRSFRQPDPAARLDSAIL